MNRAARIKQDDARDPILFYSQEDKWGVFSNFSEHGIWLPHPFTGESIWYRTGEHRFQAMKGKDEAAHDRVRFQPSAYNAKKMGREVDLREGWGHDYGHLCWYVMAELILAKAIQCKDASDALIESGDRHIYEDAPTDDIWGWKFRSNYRGKNLLGRCWMQARDILFGEV